MNADKLYDAILILTLLGIAIVIAVLIPPNPQCIKYGEKSACNNPSNKGDKENGN